METLTQLYCAALGVQRAADTLGDAAEPTARSSSPATPTPTHCWPRTTSPYWSAWCSTSRCPSRGRSPLRARCRQRLGARWSVAGIAAMHEDDVVARVLAKPALHRFPAVMARRVHALCRAPDRGRTTGGSRRCGRRLRRGRAVSRGCGRCPASATRRASIYLALLAKRFAIRPAGLGAGLRALRRRRNPAPPPTSTHRPRSPRSGPGRRPGGPAGRPTKPTDHPQRPTAGGLSAAGSPGRCSTGGRASRRARRSPEGRAGGRGTPRR